jgi:hypothetical protein
VEDQVIKALKDEPMPMKAKADKKVKEFKDGLVYREGLVVVADNDVKRMILESVHDLTLGKHLDQEKN